MTRLFADLVTDSLTEFAYDADLAGLSYYFGGHSLGLYMTLNGYNDKLHVLAKHVLERARNLKVSPDRLEVMKDQVRCTLLHEVLSTLIMRTTVGETGVRELFPRAAIPTFGLLCALHAV